jgi:hypothetical protein
MEPSAPQQTKYDTFIKLPDHITWLACTAEVAERAGLDWEDLGTRWGITVCASKTSTVRLNVGNRLLLDIRPDGAMNLFIVHPLSEPADWAGEVDVYNGFEQVKDSLCLVANDPDTLFHLLTFEDIPIKLQRHAEASGRALPRPEWHNPLVEQLLFDEPNDETDVAEEPDD